jgi:hypothetical protein
MFDSFFQAFTRRKLVTGSRVRGNIIAYTTILHRIIKISYYYLSTEYLLGYPPSVMSNQYHLPKQKQIGSHIDDNCMATRVPIVFLLVLLFSATVVLMVTCSYYKQLQNTPNDSLT